MSIYDIPCVLYQCIQKCLATVSIVRIRLMKFSTAHREQTSHASNEKEFFRQTVGTSGCNLQERYSKVCDQQAALTLLSRLTFKLFLSLSLRLEEK
ncbi:hypothetical protein ACU8KH_01606 [Lachancea thermotolerans]